ncbi:DNA ligase D [Marinimicrobium sp. ABcell2]|uniref:DNA ligase D n=1 Tax=Marinimicrobium sp. ABcell2 TaxID=3069751 RepID=UPI0027B254B2|nr:DNA ligase D [Marinimicrobium sp. ABcell2]MDQ2077571.1 DNA ligase D [Marinimicrobium sp. ABcell2]
MAERLETYQQKRNFSRTGEPGGSLQGGADQARYVMHWHLASHDHFDLRLEQDGVLRSWALPKGPSLQPGEKRLAVEVEDHPLEYGDFEGVIPQGEYGGGTAMLWDKGRWETRGKPKRDKLDFELHGKKLAGRWTLVRMHGKAAGRRKENWLLIKRSDPDGNGSRPDDLSVVSGRTMDEIAQEASPNPPVPDPKDLEQASQGSVPENFTPQLATLTDSAPEGNNWLHEIKFDGYRIMARLQGGSVQLTTRNGKDWTRRFPELAARLANLPVEAALLDGEIASFEQDGSTSFRKLQDSVGTATRPGQTDQLVYQVFDLLQLNDYDLRRTPLITRKSVLAKLLKTLDAGALVRYSDHITGQGPEFYTQACELGLEGIISKSADARYRFGRHRSWLKTKCTLQDEFIVGGYTRPSGARRGFGSLLLGGYHHKQLVYVGRVGSGFTDDQLHNLHEQLKQLQIDRSPFSGPVPEAAGVQWVAPELVVDVEFTERTQGGALRHPVYRGLREDKEASEVVMHGRAQGHSGEAVEDQTKRRSRVRADPVVAGVRLSHSDRMLYPEQGITKLDLARYYEDVQDWILPYIVNRPLSLLRCPDAWDQTCFFQKHPGQRNFAKGVLRVAIDEKRGGSSDYLYVTSVRDLVTLAQFGVLELHPWGSRIEDVESPDTLVFDLDPGPDVPWSKIAHGASGVRERLRQLGLVGFLQATGGKGLHVIVPIEPGLSWDQAKDFSHAVARAHAHDDPTNFTTNMAKTKRQGRIFIDYLRNGRGSTSIGRYSIRARKNAPVAVPLRWEELTPAISANRYTINNLRRRLSSLKRDPWEGYTEASRTITDQMFKAVGGSL